MKIVFMGTPVFAVAALTAIVESGHQVEYAVTRRDKARDRGNKVQHTPVKEKALSLGIEALQPADLSEASEEAVKIAACEPDMIVVAAFGMMLPASILNLPKYGCVNIHASLLPRWRGAAPIQRAIIAGDETTGITIMYMDEGLDTGDIVMKRSTATGGKTASALHDELAAMGAKLITEAIGLIEGGAFTRTAQDEELATYAPMVCKADGALDFSKDPQELERLIRGLDPWPGAYAQYNGEMMKIWEASPLDVENPHAAGTITGISDVGLEISAGGNTLLVTEIQMPGRRRVKIKEFLKGNKIEKFAVLG